MAHLIEPNHSQAFWDIVSRYKLAERTRGYLMIDRKRRAINLSKFVFRMIAGLDRRLIQAGIGESGI